MDTIETIISDIKYHITQENTYIPVNFSLMPTKGKQGKIQGQLFHDKTIEKDAIKWITQRININSAFERYKRYDPSVNNVAWPSHYAARLSSVDGILSQGKNVFIVFPLALGKTGYTKEEYFGFEFIDVWQSIFDDIIFPCLERVFAADTIRNSLNLKSHIPQIAYVASVFHEIGHTVGAWKAVPYPNPEIVLSKLHFEILSELATDIMTASFLEEIPEIQLFILLARIFWFGRIGFSKNDINYGINNDNDAWIGSYLWNKCILHNCIEKSNDRWAIKIENVNTCFRSILDEITLLGYKALLPNSNQDEIIKKWMEDSVPIKNGTFEMPDDLMQIFLKCFDIPQVALINHQYETL